MTIIERLYDKYISNQTLGYQSFYPNFKLLRTKVIYVI